MTCTTEARVVGWLKLTTKRLDFRLNFVQLAEQPLDIPVVVVPQAGDLSLELVNLFVLLLLALDKNDRMIETFLLQMGDVVLSEDFNFAAQVVVRALDQLEFANVLVLLQVLPQDLCTALVLALNDLEKTALIVHIQVFVHDHSEAPGVLTVNFAEIANSFVQFEVFPLEHLHAALLK